MSQITHLPAMLSLEDGRIFRGISFGALGTHTGEVCFNTSMSGYQEVLTDPSYRGQIVAMTTPHLGNYGTNSSDSEGIAPHIRGFIIEEMSDIASNWRSQSRLQDYLQKYGILAISGIDTRALTQHLRISGVMRGCLTTENMSHAEAIALAKNSSFLEEVDLVSEVTTQEMYEWDPEKKDLVSGLLIPKVDSKDAIEPLVIAYDFGVKRNILRLLRTHGLRIMVVPASTSAEAVLAMNPAGIFFSNGPGDPSRLSHIHKTARILSDQKPIFGICLGHQILGHAFGATTFKLKFGHRGANHPVQEMSNLKVIITSQNHGYALDEHSFPEELEITHRHLNDQTIAGFRHRSKPIFAVQFHPEASPGPHDAVGLFRQFAEVLGVRFVQ